MSRYRTTLVSTALTAPAVRMVAVDVWADVQAKGEDSGVSFHPVVAISATIGHTTRADGTGEVESEVEHHAIVLDTVDGQVARFNSMLCDNSAMRLVACPWPEPEDAERLAPVVEDLRADAFAKARRQAARRGPTA